MPKYDRIIECVKDKLEIRFTTGFNGTLHGKFKKIIEAVDRSIQLQELFMD